MKRSCAVCGSNRKELIYKQKFTIPSNNYFHSGYDVVICENCGFAFADNIPDQKTLEQYYREMTKKMNLIKRRKNEKEKTVEEDWLLRQYRQSVTNVTKFLDKKMSILDVGCHTGALLSMLKDRGYKKVLGLDMSEYSSRIAKQQHDIRVIVGSVFDDLDIGQHDFVILTHVLEHIRELPRFIHGLSVLMKDDALLYVEVPNALKFYIPSKDELNFSPDQQEPFQQFSVEHINYYTKVSLYNLMNNNGFDQVFMEEQLSSITILGSVWRKKGLVRDTWIKGSLERHISDSRARLVRAESVIKKIVKEKRTIYVWGAGLHTQKLLSMTELAKGKIVAFVDSDQNYKGGKLIGKSIMSPAQLKKSPILPIMVSSLKFQEEILKQIKVMNLKNEIILLY